MTIRPFSLRAPLAGLRRATAQALFALVAAASLAIAPVALHNQAHAATTLTQSAGTAKITLKNGTVVEGEIVRELNGIVWIKVTSGRTEETKMLLPDEISSIDRGTTAPAAGTPASNAPTEAPKPDAPAAEAPAAQTPAAQPAAPRSGTARRAVVLTLGEGGDKDMVGMYVMAKPLRDALPILKADNIDIVVFRINSGGGALLEIQKLSDVIYDEYRKNFRTVAWVDYAISAAAMTAHAIEEIVFMPEGAYGACTGWFGQLQAVKDRDLEEVLFQMEKISARGNHNPDIMRAMQIMNPLSASISDRGEVTFFADETSGSLLLNPKGRVLTFNSQTAAKVRFSQGTAANLEELAKVLKEPEIEWVGTKRPGFDWPIHRAEQMQMDFRERTYKDEQQLIEYQVTLDAALQMAAGMEDDRRARLAGRAREAMNRIIAAVNNNPNFALFRFNIMPERFREEWIVPTQKRISDLTRR